MAFISSSFASSSSSSFLPSSNPGTRDVSGLCAISTPTSVAVMSADRRAVRSPDKRVRRVVAGVVGCAAAALLQAGLTQDCDFKADAALLNLRGPRPSTLGVLYSRYLNSCPTTPNCISSSANVYDSHYVPAWTYNKEGSTGTSKTMEEAIADVTRVVSEYPRATIIESKPVNTSFGDGYYIYAEFESKLLGFIDDVEFYFRPDSTSSVEYRSASRLGESDLGANRTRIRDLRVALQNLDARWGSTGY